MERVMAKMNPIYRKNLKFSKDRDGYCSPFWDTLGEFRIVNPLEGSNGDDAKLDAAGVDIIIKKHSDGKTIYIDTKHDRHATSENFFLEEKRFITDNGIQIEQASYLTKPIESMSTDIIMVIFWDLDVPDSEKHLFRFGKITSAWEMSYYLARQWLENLIQNPDPQYRPITLNKNSSSKKVGYVVRKEDLRAAIGARDITTRVQKAMGHPTKG
jgi:hypothetical protein